jgi:hypothetical protein
LYCRYTTLRRNADPPSGLTGRSIARIGVSFAALRLSKIKEWVWKESNPPGHKGRLGYGQPPIHTGLHTPVAQYRLNRRPIPSSHGQCREECHRAESNLSSAEKQAHGSQGSSVPKRASNEAAACLSCFPGWISAQKTERGRGPRGSPGLSRTEPLMGSRLRVVRVDPHRVDWFRQSRVDRRAAVHDSRRTSVAPV